MKSLPIWQMVQNSARDLTRVGKVPFTRKDIFEWIEERFPGTDTNSINPIIQGITDNLKGGAPGADGKKILHSVGRGQFVLFSKKDAFEQQNTDASHQGKDVEISDLEFPESENELRDHIVALLRKKLIQRQDVAIHPEGVLAYALPDGSKINHASDVLVIHMPSRRKVSIELKYKSAVTDQFKCRAYDAFHMKQEFGNDIHTIMLFVKTKSGVSIVQAQRLAYTFDSFIGVPASSFGNDTINQVVARIHDFFAL